MTRARHILIVDDEPNIGLSLRLILEGEGYRVSVVQTAAAFHAERRRSQADLYLLDVRLPDGNGIDILRGLGLSDAGIGRVAMALHDRWHIDRIAPGHCTGEPAFAALQRVFGSQYAYAGLGTTITVP